MSTIRRSMQVPYSAEQMYSLVNDVEKYPEFLPWCEACNILNKESEVMTASVTVSKAGFNRTFKTENTFKANEVITVRVKDSLFSSLYGVWSFTPIKSGDDMGSEIAFSLDFKFKNALIKMTFGRLVEQLANTVVGAFVKRAEKLYGQV